MTAALAPLKNLRNIHVGLPAFVFGNGYSKKFFDVEKILQAGGITFACNLATQYHAAHYLVGRDDADPRGPVLERMFQIFHGPIITKDKRLTVPQTHAMQAHKGPIYGYKYVPRRDATTNRFIVTPDKASCDLAHGSSGFLAAQIAYLMGCRPIVLVGCDCQYIEGADSGNAHHKDVFDDFYRDRFRDWILQFNGLAEWLRGKGVNMFQMGYHSAISVPVYPWSNRFEKEEGV